MTRTHVRSPAPNPAAARAFALAWAGAAAFATVPAHAICGRPPPIVVAPHRGLPVPTNAHVMVTAPAAWRGDATLFLVTAPRTDDGRVLPSTRVALREQSWRAAGTERIDLTPLVPLSPSTAYELRSSRGEILGVFTTSVLRDERPPTWSGLQSGALYEAPASTPGSGGKKAIAPLECGSDRIRLRGTSAATDDQTPTDEIRYALWAGTPGAPLPYASPPLTWSTRATYPAQAQSPLEFALVYGSTEQESMDFELPKGRPLRVGVKAIDLAGNATEASELTLR